MDLCCVCANLARGRAMKRRALLDAATDATDAITVHDGGDTLQLGAFTLAKMGLVVTGTPTIAEWEHCGVVLRRIEGAVQFWIGDWVNYGERAYGEKYTDAERVTGLDVGTLMNYASVAKHVETSLRSEIVPYSIHALVAPLEHEQQAAILARAAAENLTVSKVREILRADAHDAKVAAITRGDLPIGEYDVVCADPPWQYDNSGFDQSAAAHYPTMTVEAIGALPLSDPTFPQFADPCVLFLWATSPLVDVAVGVMAEWGFDYKACLVWVKDRAPGLGWWVHTRHELLLVGVRGHTTPIEKVDSVIEAAVADHSRKPIEAYAAIDRMFPGLRRVEIFARAPRDGWDAWGNEV
jgi:N6-adenosine-specific RNA methylase IME4